MTALRSILARADQLAGVVLGPLSHAGRLKVPATLVLIMVLAALPFVIHHDAEFRSDDITLVARGFETGVTEGLWRNFTRPFLDTWIIEFYRPLFTWSFCVDSHLFGSNPLPYFIENVIWHILACCAGWFLLRRFLDRDGALLATILFLANPWAASNVSWFAGRNSTIATLVIFLGALAALRQQKKGTGLPWAAFWIAAFGAFWRETTLFLPILVALIDCIEGRRSQKDLRRWAFLSLPFAAYGICKHLVLGTILGNYTRMRVADGPPSVDPASFFDNVQEWGWAVLNLLAPGKGDGSLEMESLRIGSLTVLALLLLLGLRGFLHSPGLRILGIFAVLHGIPLLVLQPHIHGATSQRWYPVMWAVAGILAGVARHSRHPKLASLLLVLLMAASATRLHHNLEDYDRAAGFSRTIRAAIEEAPEDLVVVHGLVQNLGAGNFYAGGLGQTQLPPFSESRKAVYPVFKEVLWGPKPEQQVPLGAALVDRKAPFSVLLVDSKKLSVRTLGPMILKSINKVYRDLPRLSVHLPAEELTLDARALILDCDAQGLQRVDIHVLTTSGQYASSRFRDIPHPHGRFTDDGHYVEDMRFFLEAAGWMAEHTDGRCWIWIAGYDDPKGGNPVGVSEFMEVRSSLRGERPPGR